MDNKSLLLTAMKQSAVDLNCNIEDFLKDEHVIVRSLSNEKARKYLKLPFYIDLVSYGNNIVVSVSDEFKDIAEDFINSFEFYHCFETPNIYYLNDKLKPFNAAVCFMAEYWLPDLNVLKPLDCGFETKFLCKSDFKDLYTKEWSNALCESRKELDVLAVGAYDNNKLIGLAGCSADCDSMWQIGVDVLPEYRRKGIASSLTSKLAAEIIKRGKVPFYCCAWSNLKSVGNALKSGFRPAWVEITVKDNSFINEMNKAKTAE
ncbi:MAG: GNAT family N-acetyltransferase [Ruminococcaceae bacterium]|nr:GNAT family N-acetyltransferase [Oscillospiraceae bacterium]